ncbi:phospholipase B1, membrane-associated-like [Periplaneta americana]|uniref:phospholipase B1, membrane-associated-like n=1 Tax=Periplaneta americana TaxID=6978 RepID=UPI0037E9AA58
MRLLPLLVIATGLLVTAGTQSGFQRWINQQYDVFRKGFWSGLQSHGSASRRPSSRNAITRPERGNDIGDTSKRFANRFQNVVPQDQPFPCDTSAGAPGMRSPTRPTSVHRLRPGDIDVIGAMGDSLTAANGAAAASLAEVYIENRGMSWSGGGEKTWREYLTLPNILKEFNPNLIGYSLRDSLGSERASQFNVGEPLAISSDMLFQARLLVRRMKTDKRVDYERDWKMVTIMVGPNDFCSHMCYMRNPSNEIKIHHNELVKALNYLRDNMPRVIINLVAPPQLRALRDIPDFSSECYITHAYECPCLFGLLWKDKKESFTAIMSEVQNIDIQMSTKSEFNTKDDFAVVSHSYLRDTHIPTKTSKSGNVGTDFNFLSEDCFHFSQRTQAAAANTLWNSLLEPVGNKSSTHLLMPFERFLCPTEEHPYICTNNNS